MEQESTQKLAEKIALFLQQETNENGDNLLRASLEKINQRLETIESQIASSNSILPTYLQKQASVHSSQNQFTNLESLADEITNNIQNEKACPYEPTGKPCDHCAMCNSLGF